MAEKSSGGHESGGKSYVCYQEAQTEPKCWSEHFGIVDTSRLHSEQDWGLPSQYCKEPDAADVPGVDIDQPHANPALVRSQTATPPSSGSIAIGSWWMLLFGVLLVLKLTGSIKWPWIVVLAPVMVQCIVFVSAVCCMLFVYSLRHWRYGSDLSSGGGQYRPV